MLNAISDSRRLVAGVLLWVAAAAHAENELWQEVATGLAMPYGTLLVEDSTYVSTVPEILSVDEQNGSSTVVATFAEGSPSGMLLDDDRTIVAVENGSGSLLRVDQDFNPIAIIAEGLGDPVTVKRFGKAYYVTDYNFGTGDGRLLRIGPSGQPKVYAKLSAPGSFHIDEGGIVVAEFDSGTLVHITHQGRQKQIIAQDLGNPLDVVAYDDGYLVSDFGNFDGKKGRLLYVTRSGRVTVLGDGELGNPAGLLVQGGALYVTDLIGGRLLKANLYQLFAQVRW